MACSKIFSGDLPELTNEIIQYFRKDFSTLYSCILINRLWCRLAIPLLWEDPFPKKYLFSKIHPTNYHFIEIYLSKLNEDIKTKLYEYGVNNNLIISNTLLFNYPSFIKYLNIDKILNSVQTWVYTVVGKNQELVNLIYGSLLEMFIENEGNLHSFEVILPICYDVNYFNKSIDLILQNPNLTHNIRNLTFRIYNYNNQNIIKLLKFLYSNCNSISSMALDFPNYGDDYSLISEKCLTQIYISQNNLKKISFGSFVNLYNPFLTLKNSNCSNTLNTIIFYFIDFKNIISILQEVFDQLNVLESIHILYCNSLNSDFVQQIIKVNNPFKLRSLFINKILHFESLQLLLQKFSDCLENFGFASMMFNEYNEPKRQLFEFITKYCKNIRYFESGIPDDNIIYLFIENNQNNINYLTIEANTYNTDYEELSSIVLQNLGQVLPSKLEYLCLSLSFTISDLEIFLKNSQNTFIKKLLISDIVGRLGKKILFCIKKYIIKRERVKYLAITNNNNIDNEFLFTLRNEVNEFKLHNIIVKEFHDLHSSPYIFIDNYF